MINPLVVPGDPAVYQVVLWTRLHHKLCQILDHLTSACLHHISSDRGHSGWSLGVIKLRLFKDKSHTHGMSGMFKKITLKSNF